MVLPPGETGPGTGTAPAKSSTTRSGLNRAWIIKHRGLGIMAADRPERRPRRLPAATVAKPPFAARSLSFAQTRPVDIPHGSKKRPLGPPKMKLIFIAFLS